MLIAYKRRSFTWDIENRYFMYDNGVIELHRYVRFVYEVNIYLVLYPISLP